MEQVAQFFFVPNCNPFMHLHRADIGKHLLFLTHAPLLTPHSQCQSLKCKKS
jgi:hypothetical protein